MCKVPNGFHVCTYYNKAPEVFFFLLLKSFIFNLITLFDDWWFSNSFPSKVHISMTTHHTWLDQDFFSSLVFTVTNGHCLPTKSALTPWRPQLLFTQICQRVERQIQSRERRKQQQNYSWERQKKIYATAKSHKWMVGWRMAVGIIWERLSL